MAEKDDLLSYVKRSSDILVFPPAALIFTSLTDSHDYMKLLDLLMMEGMYNFDVLHVMSQWIGQLPFSRGSSTQ